MNTEHEPRIDPREPWSPPRLEVLEVADTRFNVGIGTDGGFLDASAS